MLPCCQCIVTQCAIGIAIQFSHITQIIQSERILRIQQVRFIEQLLGFFLVTVLELRNPLAIELLTGVACRARGEGPLIRSRSPALSRLQSASPAEQGPQRLACTYPIHSLAGIRMPKANARLSTVNTLRLPSTRVLR